jgi:hypothetical protein
MDTSSPRNRRILAVILALVASLFLCVWGAAAAGLQITSPLLESVFGQDTVSFGAAADGDGDADAAGGVSANGDVTASVDADVDGDADTSADDGDGDADGTEDDADADGVGDGDDDAGDGADGDGDGNGGGDSGDATADSGQRCFLNLICLTSSVGTATTDDAALIDVNVDGDGANVRGDLNTDREPEVEFNVNTEADGDASGLFDTGTFLGIDISALLNID